MTTKTQLNGVKQQDVNPIKDYLIPTAKFAKAERYYMPTENKETHNQTLLAGKPAYFDLKAGGEIKTLLLNYEELQSVTYVITGFDEVVINTIYSMLMAGNKYVTIEQITRKVYCINTTPKETQIKAVEKSLFKLSKMVFEFDFSGLKPKGENKEKYENLKKEKTMKESAISLEKTSIRTRNGKITDGFIITDKPLFCKVAEMMGEITTINYQHKQIVFNEIDSNKRNINLFEYLIKRISTIKYYKTDDKAKKTKKGKEYSNRIAYSKFFEEVFLREEQTLKTEGSIERTKRKIKPIINIMLNLLKKENYIKDFEYYKTINNKTYRYSQGIEMMF
jgi:hypothetical protein